MTAKSTYVPFDDSVPIDPVYRALGVSWRRALLAQNMAPKTIETYLEAHRRFGLFLAQRELPQRPREITREHIELWLIHLMDSKYRPASVSNRYRSLQQWFKWLLDEEEIKIDPTARMKPPKIPEEHKPVLPEAHVKALLKTCRGSDFRSRRDLAMFTLLFDTGMRRGELTSITLERLSLDEQLVLVTGKNRQDRVIAFGRQTTRVLDRYLRSRATHRLADDPHLFVGLAGPITGNGLRQILTYRARQTGIPELEHIHPHLFRHTYAHLFLKAGGQETELMDQVGWKSSAMARLYGAALRAERAQDTAKRLSPGDRLGL